ncbi:MAG: hypothetical protein WBM55_02585 [Muriicola sp.]
MIRGILFFLLFYTSCSVTDDPLQSDRWELSSTYGYMTQTEQDVSELPYTETVEFISDGTFLKTRFTQDESEIINGRWIPLTRDGRSGFFVTYAEDHPFIQNCTTEPQEFYFPQQGRLIQNDYTPCDGPEYRYVRAGD